MQVRPSLCEGLHSTEGLAHHEHAVNGRVVTIAVNPHKAPLAFVAWGCQSWFTWHPVKSRAGLEEPPRAVCLGKGPVCRPHMLKAL